jgi:hypothetical protein
MDNEEARTLLTHELERYRCVSYSDLISLLEETKHIEAAGSSGAKYQIDIYRVWDDKPNGNLRIIGAVDDFGWRAFAPLTDSFILRPDGTFVDE